MATANQRLKERWSACLLGSTLVASAVHLVLVGIVPPWEFPVRALREQGTTFVQLVPISPRDEAVAPDPDIQEPLPAVAAVQPEILEPDELTEPLLPDWLPVIRIGPVPPAVPRLEPRAVSVQAPPGWSELKEMVAPVAWPQITNPERMTGYIRGRYNPILAADGVRGTVVLALWIDERGEVARVVLMESSGAASLDEIAVTTFEEVVTFSPARDGPRALPVQFNLSVPFLTAW